MSKQRSSSIEISGQQINVIDGMMEMNMCVKVKFAMPAQDNQLPGTIEEVMEAAGQQYKRRGFEIAMAGADEELLKERQKREVLVRRGKKPYTFKTIFGEAIVSRNRVSQENGQTEIPAHHAWGTPQQVSITPGLRAAVCDLALKESLQSTLIAIEQRAKAPGILSRRSVLNILHREGAALIEAQQARAQAVFAEMPQARSLIVVKRKSGHKHEPLMTYDFGYDMQEEEIIGERVIFSWEQRVSGSQSEQIIYYEKEQRTQADGLIIAQLDEVKVIAQAQSGKKEIWIYSGVVNANGHSYYFSTSSSAALFYQVGSLLAVLGAHKGEREIYIISDGARWIRNWYNSLPVARKSFTLCWYHLTEACHDLLVASFGRIHSLPIESKLISKLWRGDVSGVLADLEKNKELVINAVKFRELKRYLKARQPYIADYETRRNYQQWIANTRVEKYNDWSVSSRCKVQGMQWTEAGVRAIAALVAARRNGELAQWRRSGKLPAWEERETISYQQ